MKTQKNFRKRALLSSVAMLLVATVAVGSATFAWFSTNNTATADGVTVSTSKASNIVLCKTNSENDAEWKSRIDLETDQPLEPGSTTDLTNWFSAKSASYGVNAEATDKDGNNIGRTEIGTGTANTNYIVKTFYVKSTVAGTEEDPINASYTISTKDTAADQLNYVRAAVKISDLGDEPTIVTSSFYSNGTNDYDKRGITSIAGATGTQTISTSPTGTINLTDGKAKKVDFYVWFEGEDHDCTDLTAGVEVDFDVTFAKV